MEKILSAKNQLKSKQENALNESIKDHLGSMTGE